ncbi:hypothetical protein BRD04_02415 [Halobacteriales archaeon QS_9_67_17]|nr:MAG: hypothetical protein BRD04_02415 [Halobacteriales archaeon QS_9_67_17]
MSTDEREPSQDFREGIRTPQAFAVPVVGALVVWLTTVASNLLYVMAGALLFVVTVAMSMETVEPRTVERRLYPGAAVALVVLGGLAVATGSTDSAASGSERARWSSSRPSRRSPAATSRSLGVSLPPAVCCSSSPRARWHAAASSPATR